MMRITLSESQARELGEAFKGSSDRKLRGRVRIVMMAHRDRPREQVAADLCADRRTVQRWLNACWERGLEGLRARTDPRGGRPGPHVPAP